MLKILQSCWRRQFSSQRRKLSKRFESLPQLGNAFIIHLLLMKMPPVLRADNLAAFTKYGWETFGIILELRKLFDIRSELRIIDFLICESLLLDLYWIIMSLSKLPMIVRMIPVTTRKTPMVIALQACQRHPVVILQSWRWPDGDDYADDHDDETYGDDHSYGDDNHGDDHGCPTSMPETPGSDHAIILMMPIATTMMIIMIVMMKWWR